MICIIALVVFSILGIFSATHRKIAIEAFDCVFRKITVRKCQTGRDKRLKSQITGGILRKSPIVGRIVYKNFEIFSWIFLIIMFTSLFFAGRGVYWYARYGNCNGPQHDGFCIFDPQGFNKHSFLLCIFKRCPTWIRTMIDGFKGHCPAIRRSGMVYNFAVIIPKTYILTAIFNFNKFYIVIHLWIN